jgi:hypothetical protein
MSVAPAEFIKAARDGWLDNLERPVPALDPLVLQQFHNTPDPGGVGTVRGLNRVSRPSEEANSSFECGTGNVAVLTAGLDSAEKE